MSSFVVAVLAVWRLTHLLAAEDGPADIVVRLRRLLGNSLAGKMMDCFYCLSVWIAAPAALFVTHRPMSLSIAQPQGPLSVRILSGGILEWAVNWLAISGAACLLERLTTPRAAPQSMPAPEQQLQESSHEGESENVLRFKSDADQEQSVIHTNNPRHPAHQSRH